MKKTCLTIFLCLLIVRPGAHGRGMAGNAPRVAGETLSLSKREWRADLKYLAKELPEKHKNAFHTVSREEFERAIAELDAKLDTLQTDEVVVGLQQIVAMIGDGHTYLQLPKSYRRYPISFFIFGDGIRVWRTTVAYQRALGSKVAQIGSLDVNGALTRLLSVAQKAENRWWVLELIQRYLRYPNLLRGLGIITEGAGCPFTFEDQQGKRFSLDIEAISQEAEPEWVYAMKELPPYEQKPDKDFWFSYLADFQTVYVNFRGYGSLKEQSEALFDFIDRNPVRRLIIDLRDNGGGNYFKGRALLVSAIKKRPSLNQGGKIFVIIGRRTMSAAVVNAIDLRKEVKAILVGKPTGGRPNNYGERRQLCLPNSGLTVHYSASYYKFQDEDTPGVMPDEFIALLWSDYAEGRDAAMEWILSCPVDR